MCGMAGPVGTMGTIVKAVTEKSAQDAADFRLRDSTCELLGHTIWAIKLDVEGSAGAALRGARRLLAERSVRHWFVGIHNRDEWRTVRELLSERNGYEVLRTRRAGGGVESGAPNGFYAVRARGEARPFAPAADAVADAAADACHRKQALPEKS